MVNFQQFGAASAGVGGNHLIISFILSTRLISKLAREDVVLDAITSVSVRSGEVLSLETWVTF